MKKIFILTLLCLAFAFTAKAQDLEYGKPTELKGKTKIFVDTEGDIENRDRIIEVLTEAKLKDIELLDSSDRAEIVLLFFGNKQTVMTGVNSTPIYGSVLSTPRYKKMRAGRGFIYISSADGKKARVLMSFESTQNRIGEKRPATKFAKEFIEAYREANGLKN